MPNRGPRTKESTPTERELRAYSVTQVLDLVPIGRTKLYEEIRDGRLITMKVGSRTLITAGALGAWLYAADNDDAPQTRSPGEGA